ncbi:MAG: fibrobacter succinogenes major paralogous domain-containing protein [Candidatus Fibromonas sp.]|jgi:uncharacterized protein (TIGR02145 family)|nr:fibrobacter succinogenes major paralogous domain-containing protein [Candidatus Fibromonas sp.]
MVLGLRKKFPFIRALCFTLMLFGCTQLERDNIYDPDGINYDSNAFEASSSSNESISSSSLPAEIPSSSSVYPSSSSILLYSSSSLPGFSSPSSSSHFFGGGGKGNNIDNYRTIRIGNQNWMAENLNYDVEGSRCYNDLESNCDEYGRLYDWATAMAIPDLFNMNIYNAYPVHQGICPDGWHIPSNDDWDTLMDYAGGSSTASRYLKATSGWYYDGNGTDNFYFSAFPGGYGYSNGNFFNAGSGSYWWSSSEYNGEDAYNRDLYYIYEDVYMDNASKSYLFSVRCLQDDE